MLHSNQPEQRKNVFKEFVQGVLAKFMKNRLKALLLLVVGVFVSALIYVNVSLVIEIGPFREGGNTLAFSTADTISLPVYPLESVPAVEVFGRGEVDHLPELTPVVAPERHLPEPTPVTTPGRSQW